MRKKESYTSLSLIDQCPYQYKLHYVDGIYKHQEAIALDIGNLCHKILELQRDPNSNITTEELLEILRNGYYDYPEKAEGTSNFERIDGILSIKEKYFEDYISTNAKSGLSYIDKMANFRDYIINYKPDNEWQTIAVEMPFSIEYRGFMLTGKIDRVDINMYGDYKVVDYKTANVAYDDKKLKTPLQMYIYALAIKEKYGKFPIEFEYDFVVLNQKAKAMSKGWENRGDRALNNLIDSREAYYAIKDFPPKPTPLCHWCPYVEKECEYYSLWTPDNKTFEVNKEYVPFSEQKSKKTEEFEW